MKNMNERGKSLFVILGSIASIVCAVKALYDIVHDLISYYKQRSNRPDQN